MSDQRWEVLLEPNPFVFSLAAIFATPSSIALASYTVVNTLR